MTVPAKTVVANRITLGDRHDQSIESFLKKTEYPIYIITRISGERFRVEGCYPEEKKAPKKDKPKIFKMSKKKKKNGKG